MAEKRAAIVGLHEFPSRFVRGEFNPLQVKVRSAAQALEDAGLSWSDVDALYDCGDSIMWPGLYMPEYLDLEIRKAGVDVLPGAVRVFDELAVYGDLAG